MAPHGINQALKHLLVAARRLDDGHYLKVKDALNHFGWP